MRRLYLNLCAHYLLQYYTRRPRRILFAATSAEMALRGWHPAMSFAEAETVRSLYGHRSAVSLPLDIIRRAWRIRHQVE